MGVQIGQVCAARTRTCDAADAAPNRQLRAWRWTVAGHKTSGPAGLVWHQGRRETCWPARRARPYGPSVRRSPQEKKALSYARDCRNVYGENDKSSRKNIPRVTVGQLLQPGPDLRLDGRKGDRASCSSAFATPFTPASSRACAPDGLTGRSACACKTTISVILAQLTSCGLSDGSCRLNGFLKGFPDFRRLPG